MYNVTETAEIVGLRKNKLLQHIREGKIEPTVFSLTGRHLFDDNGVKSVKKFLEEESKVIKSTEAASILGVTVATLLKYVKKGLITPIKVVNEINYFDKEEVEKLSLSFGSVDFDNLIQAGEASEILGVSIARMNQLVAQNRLIPDRVLPGGKHLYLRGKIERIAELAREIQEDNKTE